MNETTQKNMKKKEEETEDEEPSFEMVLEKLGATGKFQIRQIIFCYLSIFLTSSIILSFVFEGYEPAHVCSQVNNTELLASHGLQNDSTARVVYESCHVRILANQTGEMAEAASMNCPNGRNFFNDTETTFLSEWDLVCESRGVAEVSQTCFSVGQMIGAIIGPSIADRIGRKPVLCVASFFASLFEFCIMAAPNIFAVYGLKLVSGMFYQAVTCTFFVYGMEFVTPKYREANGFIMCVIWVIGTNYIGAVGYFFRNHSWRFFQGGVGAAGMICLLYPFVLEESPRWLAANGKIDETLRVLKRASDVNGADFLGVKETLLTYVNHVFSSSTSTNARPLKMVGQDDDDDDDGDDRNGIPGDVLFQDGNANHQKKPNNMLDLIRFKSLRKITLITWYLFLTNVLTYFGIYMTSSNVAGNRFLNFTLMNLVELPSSILVLVMMKKMKRRLVMELFLGLTAVSLLFSTLLDTFAEHVQGSGTASTFLFILGKFAISSSFNLIFIVAPELFPTNLRSTANGFCSGFARIGGMLAPFMRPLYHTVKWGPGLIFTTMCLVAVGLTSLLPETKDVVLPDTVDDVTGMDENRNEKKALA